MEDFKAALTIDESSSLSFIGIAECYRFLKDYNRALHYFSKAVKNEDEYFKEQALLKRGILYLQMH